MEIAQFTDFISKNLGGKHLRNLHTRKARVTIPKILRINANLRQYGVKTFTSMYLKDIYPFPTCIKSKSGFYLVEHCELLIWFAKPPISVVQKLQTPFVVFLCPKDSVSVKKLLLTEKYCKYQP